MKGYTFLKILLKKKKEYSKCEIIREKGGGEASTMKPQYVQMWNNSRQIIQNVLGMIHW